MGDNRKGRAQRIRRDGHLDEEMTEALENMAKAFPSPVPFDQMHHLTNGAVANVANVANTIARIRRSFGYKSIKSVHGYGYAATQELFDAVARRKRATVERKIGRLVIQIFGLMEGLK